MASLRKRGDRWQARVTLGQGRVVAKTFSSKQLARDWALSQQYEHLKTGSNNARPFKSQASSNVKTFADLLKRYAKEVSPQKKGSEVERIRIEALLKRDLSNLPLANLTHAAAACYRDARLKEVKADTVRREFNLLRHVWSVAHQEWDQAPRDNPFEGLRMPKASPHRERTLSQEEWERLKEAAQEAPQRFLYPMLLLAYESGLRRSELLNLRRTDLDLSRGDLKVRDSKSGFGRVVFLRSSTCEALSYWLLESDKKSSVFTCSIYGLRYAFERALKIAGIDDFRWHDLRHCATSRLAEAGLSPIELMALTGHRQLTSLMRYAHLSGQHLKARLEKVN